MPQAHQDFGRLLAAVRAARPGPAIVLGAVDCGKTTLVRQLAAVLAADAPIWLVAGDPGQAWIGPPAAVARVRLVRPRLRRSQLAPERMIFLGSTSPAPCPAQTAAALARLVREGVPAGNRVVVDTPGLVCGRLAETLWGLVAATLRPPLVVAIDRRGGPGGLAAGRRCGRAAGRRTRRARRGGAGMAPVLRLFRAAGSQVVLAEPHPLARVRRQAERAAYRAAAYRRYFGRARLRFIEGGVPVVSAFSGGAAALDVGRLV
ncbi:MAG: hypothetical protein FJ288_02930, partial [Planctomycetes bacterium]|nr:hypothetical protein [Planctomycetota bacterium]